MEKITKKGLLSIGFKPLRENKFIINRPHYIPSLLVDLDDLVIQDKVNLSVYFKKEEVEIPLKDGGVEIQNLEETITPFAFNISNISKLMMIINVVTSTEDDN